MPCPLALAACGDGADVQTSPDAAAELPDPNPDGPLDVDPLSRPDGQTSDDNLDSVETGDDLFNTPVEEADPSDI